MNQHIWQLSLQERSRRIAAGDVQWQIRKLQLQPGPHLTEKPVEPLDVGCPVEAANKRKRRRGRQIGKVGRIILHLQANRRHHGRYMATKLAENSEVALCDGGQQVVRIQAGSLVGLEFARQVAQVEPPDARLAAFDQPLPDFMLDIVRAHHHQCIGLAANQRYIGRQIQRLQLNQVIVLLGEHLGQHLLVRQRMKARNVVRLAGKKIGKGCR